MDDPFLKAQNIRFVVVNNYLAFYIIDESRHIVHIIRFLYGKRDWITVISISRMREKLIEGLNTPLEDTIPEEELVW